MIKTVNDYYDKLYEMFPNVSKQDIKAIVKYGWQKFYNYNLQGCDILIKDSNSKDFWMYIGQMFDDSLEHYNYYKKKLIRKIRTVYSQKHRNEPKDNIYYMPISINDYDKVFNNGFKVYNRYVYKILDEAKIRMKNPLYIFKIELPFYAGLSPKLNYFNLENAELVYIRKNTLTMSELQVESKNYDL